MEKSFIMRKNISFFCIVFILICHCFFLETVSASSYSNPSPIQLNTAYQGIISQVDERDWYQFDVKPNYRYYIVVWADNTFGTVPTGLRDTQLRAYLDKGNGDVSAWNNTDAPIALNLGYGSTLWIEAIPMSLEPVKASHCVAPSSVIFFVEQQDLSPETGSYSFKVFEELMPMDTTGSYDYYGPFRDALFNGPINPPGNTVPAPTSSDDPVIVDPSEIESDSLDIALSTKSGVAPFTVMPTVMLNNNIDVTSECEFLYENEMAWQGVAFHTYVVSGTYWISARYTTDEGVLLMTDPVQISVSPSSPSSSSFENPASIELNIAYQGEISEVDERDWYQFEAKPNYRYYIVVWADNTFGTVPSGLRDTQLRAYLNKGGGEISAWNNTDAAIALNLGYGSSLWIEAIPSNIEPTKASHCVAPSNVIFFIEQQDLSPETGSYSFKVYEEAMPKDSNGNYDYYGPFSDPLFDGPINPPAVTLPAPVPDDDFEPKQLSLSLTNRTGVAPLTIFPRVFFNGLDVTSDCEFIYGEGGSGVWVSQGTYEYRTPGTYQLVARYTDAGNILVSNVIDVAVTAALGSIEEMDLSLMAIDVEDELTLWGNGGLHVYVWYNGNSFDTPVEQFFVLSVFDQWYALDNHYQWNLTELSDENLFNSLPTFKVSALDNSYRETVLSIPDYLLPYGDVSCVLCIDNVIDDRLTLEEDHFACKSLLIRHVNP